MRREGMASWSLRPLEVSLQLLPEGLFGRGFALVDQATDRLPELVERHRPDGCFALGRCIAVHPEGDAVLVVRIEREEFLTRDLVDLLGFRVGSWRRDQ